MFACVFEREIEREKEREGGAKGGVPKITRIWQKGIIEIRIF